MRFFYTLLLSCFLISLFATDCNNGRYLQPIFSRVDVKKDIVYAKKLQSDGHEIALAYDVYQPHGDTVSLRPVMLLLHGGAYLKLLDQNSPDIVLLCKYFAQRGYVTVSIDYRQESNPFALLSEETMVKAVSRALIDTKDAVDHLMLTFQNGNPYRIDTSKAIIGGVSAGAVSALFIGYLDSLQQLSPQYQQWIIEANGDSADYILRHKFDLVKPKAIISISGALLDTNWIHPNGIDLLLNHGSADEIVPYNFGRPFNLQQLPFLFGGKSLFPRAINQGIRCEFEDWLGRGHVPFMNLELSNIITLNLINEEILDSTERHIANFIYPILNCTNIIIGVQQHKLGEIQLYPNPNNGSFTLQLPKSPYHSSWTMQIFNTIGQLVLSKSIPMSVEIISIGEKIPAGMYYLKLSYEHDQTIDYYSGAFSVAD